MPIERLRAVLGDDTFAQRFAVEGEVGRGGMGSVHRAIDRDTQQPVAIKVLHASAQQARFVLEAETLERLSHPAIVAYVGHGVTREGDAYLAMAWLDGESLAERLERGPLSVNEAITMGARIASALSHAHAHGIVHRDIKPSNVMLVDKDPRRTTLIDFGIAKDTIVTHGLTETGQLVGTPGYMSPEQAMGTQTLDARTDLFSFGALLYHALAGTPPFEGRQTMEVLAQLLLRDPPSVRDVRPDVPARLATLVAALLVKEPAQRLSDAAAVETELQAIAHALEHADTAALGAPSPLDVERGNAPTKVERPQPSPLHRVKGPARITIAIALLAGVGGAIAIYVMTREPSKPPSPSPSPSRALPCERDNTCAARCARDDAQACRAAGRAAYIAAKGNDEQQRAGIVLLDKGCALGDATACSLAGTWMRRRSARGDPTFTREQWIAKFERGCALEDGSSCALLAEHLLAESPANFEHGLALYLRGCTHMNTASCTHAAEMFERRSASGDVERAAELRKLACDRGDRRACR